MFLDKHVSCTPHQHLKHHMSCGLYDVNELTLAWWVVTGACTGAPKYLGCFRDSSDRALPGGGMYGSTLTIGRCQLAAYMGQYKYFGTQVGVECWLGNDLTVATHYGPATNCDYVCAGNSSTLCGGAWANSMYQTSAEMPGGLARCSVSTDIMCWHAASAHIATCMAQQLPRLLCC